MPEEPTRIEHPVSTELTNDRDQIAGLIDSIVSDAQGSGMNNASVFAIRLALEEAITNAFVHGHRELSQDATILVEYRAHPGAVEIAVEDRGPGFDPTKLPDPTLDENLSKPSGRGVMLMKAYMSDVVYNDRGNRVLMRFQSQR